LVRHFGITAPEQNKFPVLQFRACFDRFGALLRAAAAELCANLEHCRETVADPIRPLLSVSY
jgi:hypothetical protein